MRIFNILSALANRKNTYLYKNATATSPATAGPFEIAAINIQEAGTYLVLTFVDLDTPASEWPHMLINSITTSGTLLSNTYSTRGIIDGGGGLVNYALIDANAGDYVKLTSYNTTAGKTPTVRGDIVAIKLVGGG